MQRCKRHGFDPWVRKIPWRRARLWTPVFLPEKSHEQRSLAGTVHRVAQLCPTVSNWVGHNCSNLAHTENISSWKVLCKLGFLDHLKASRKAFNVKNLWSESFQKSHGLLLDWLSLSVLSLSFFFFFCCVDFQISRSKTAHVRLGWIPGFFIWRKWHERLLKVGYVFMRKTCVSMLSLENSTSTNLGKLFIADFWAGIGPKSALRWSTMIWDGTNFWLQRPRNKLYQ